MSAATALDFTTAALAVVLQDIDPEGVFTFALAFIPAAFSGRFECAADIEDLARSVFPDDPAACREIAGLLDQMIALVRQVED